MPSKIISDERERQGHDVELIEKQIKIGKQALKMKNVPAALKHCINGILAKLENLQELNQLHDNRKGFKR